MCYAFEFSVITFAWMIKLCKKVLNWKKAFLKPTFFYSAIQINGRSNTHTHTLKYFDSSCWPNHMRIRMKKLNRKWKSNLQFHLHVQRKKLDIMDFTSQFHLCDSPASTRLSKLFFFFCAYPFESILKSPLANNDSFSFRIGLVSMTVFLFFFFSQWTMIPFKTFAY